MSVYNSLETANFGKIAFTPRNHTVPSLPDMNLIIFKNGENYQAICIDLELDSVGDKVENACRNLRQRLLAYTTQMVQNYNNDVRSAAEDIISTAYSRSELKIQLFNRYAQAKQQFLLDKLANKKKARSRREDFFKAIHRVFQIEPISLNLTLAAGLA